MLQGSRNREAVAKRAEIIKKIREFFEKRGFLEVETPFLLPYIIPEAHIDAIKAGDGYLHTSPELCMKFLLAKGYGNIFQICKCFRKGERGRIHLPEFTMLEWYHVGIDYNGLMRECEELIIFLCEEMSGKREINYRGKKVDLTPSWEEISLEEAFKRYASISLEDAINKGRFEEIMVNEIEPNLGIEKPTFVKDYPSSMCALSKIKDNFAERFELYIAGLELANGYTELTDLNEIKKRLEEENEKRKKMGKEVYPMPEEFFLKAKRIPECAGIALGLDRLIMLLLNEDDIRSVVTLTWDHC